MVGVVTGTVFHGDMIGAVLFILFFLGLMLGLLAGKG